jgi:hypothetical protein
VQKKGPFRKSLIKGLQNTLPNYVDPTISFLKAKRLPKRPYLSSGLVVSSGRPAWTDHSAYFGLAKLSFRSTLSGFCSARRRWPSSLWGRPHGRPRCDVARSAGPAGVRRSELDSSGLAPGGVYPRPRHRGAPCALTARFHPYRLLRGGGMFLWHFPSSYPDRTLSCTLPDGARTFLDARAPRLPCPASAFLVCPSRGFGIVYVLAPCGDDHD